MSSRPTKIPRVHKHTLIEMNLAVFTARRDAAHARVAAVLREEIPVTSREERVRLYALCHGLVDEAIHATRRSQFSPDTPLLRYLKLLQNTVAVNEALLNYEIALAREGTELSQLVGSALPSQLRTDGDTFTPGEKAALTAMQELLKFGERLIQQDSRGRRKTYSGDDLRRYDLAWREYVGYYAARFRPLRA